jgi:hypothetical protein
MVVALGTTLINKNIRSLLLDGEYTRIRDGYTNGTDIFIGAIVTRKGETKPDIDLCAEDQMFWGIVTGWAPNMPGYVADATGPWYRDYDNPFPDNKWVRVAIPGKNDIILVLSATNETIAIDDPLKVVDGVMEVASTGDDIIAVAQEAVTGATNTRKYFYARFK